MKVLITGSSGQVGTNLALALLELGCEVRGVDVRANSWTDRVPTDVVDLVAVARGEAWDLPFEPDCIVHLAAWAKVHDLVVDPTRALENIEMTCAALEAARRVGCPILVASSREVYGDIQLSSTPEHHADHVVAQSPYSASKLASEAMVHSYSRCYGLPCMVVRLSNVYGRYDCDLERMERVIPLFVRRINDDLPIRVFGPEKVLDFTYVDDCVQALVSGVQKLVGGAALGETTLNVSYGEGHSLLDLVGLIGTSLGRSPMVQLESVRVGEISRYVGDISRARSFLDYSPQVSLPEGIERYVQWWRDTGRL
jgi:UDP-glucose 4-epimerase